jgi:aspartyl-tRNA(Asn)/glutamyl-tRNA(Gln) amidotransferase subunit B
MKGYSATIGLEIHVELKTKSKMFCSCKNDPDETRPNYNICPVCTAQPGTLPVINKEAVRHVLRVGAATGSSLADFTEWDRKNYFYPDIPKGYQISQYKYPLVSGGSIRGVELTRIHLEEDTASNVHDQGDYSLVDYNRAGVPLMELVTEPVIHDAETAVLFAKELQLLLRYLGASDANMEKGEMRVEANVSVSKTEKFGTKVEVKNLNSFRSVEGAIRYEIDRQIAILEDGGAIVQETRGWDETKGSTFSQRKKESSHDYRYFPDPDLPKMVISEIPEFRDIGKDLPELPWEKRARLLQTYGFSEETAEMYVANRAFGELFDGVAAELAGDTETIRIASNYITSDLAALSKASGNGVGNINAASLSTLMLMLKKNELSSRGAKDLLKMLYETGGEPKALAERHGLMQKSDPEALRVIVRDVIAANEKVVAEYRGGKEASLQFLIGQGMKASKGSANPQVLARIFKDEIAKG